MSSLFADCCTCHTAPCNWMCWQHNDIGRWQKAGEREAEHCPVSLTGDALVSKESPLSALNPTKMSESQQGGSNAISQHTASVCVDRDVIHCIIYLTERYCTFSKLTLKRGSEACKSLITYFITVMTFMSQR